MMLDRLKELREYYDKTQEEIANILGVDRTTYTGWETGKDMIPLGKLNDLANYYHTSLDYLIGKSPTKEEVEKLAEINIEIVSKNLKEFRKSNNLTQAKLAKSITTSQSNFNKYENGKSLITTYYALEFSRKYNYSLDTLVGRKKKTKKQNK